MANTNINKNKPGNSIGATAAQLTLTEKVKEVWVSNSHATQAAYVKVYTGSTAAIAAAAAVAGNGTAPVSATADGAIYIPPASVRRVNVFKSTRPTFVALDVIATGATTPIHVESVV